jgi:hypothetical protein
MKRRLFNLAAAMSMLMCIAVCGMWVRSYSTHDWTYGVPTHSIAIHSSTGAVIFEHFPYEIEDGWEYWSAKSNRYWSTFLSARGHWWNYLGFAYDVIPALQGTTHTFAVPDYLPAVLTALLPVLWLARFGRARRHLRDGLCQRCGYDLRATPDRCPECGLAAVRAAVEQT